MQAIRLLAKQMKYQSNEILLLLPGYRVLLPSQKHLAFSCAEMVFSFQWSQISSISGSPVRNVATG